MPKFARILRYLLIFLLILLFSGCASSKRSSWEKKRRTAARVNIQNVGRNKFFYSTNYQKKLVRSYKNRR